MATSYFLAKTEPDAYSIDDLKRQDVGSWDGVRNFQARNIMRDQMKVGDYVLFYHSNTKPPGVIGLARVHREAYPDHTQFDPASKYYDDKASEDAPRWMMVDVKFVEKFPRLVSLDELKDDPELEGMLVVKRGMRLSVQPVERPHFVRVLKLAGAKFKAPRR
jgi:predicted RNA-binding protein with PUA-like domain